MPEYDGYTPALREIMRKFDDEIVELFKTLRYGDLSPRDWRAATQKLIAKYMPAAMMAGAKRADLLPDQLEAIENRLGVQLGYFNNFADIVEQGIATQVEFVPISATNTGKVPHYLRPADLPWKQYEVRLRKYVGALVAPYWQGVTGALPLPAIPGDGTSQCIVSGDSRVLTARGLVPISDVVIGDFVLTHRNRWRRVTNTVISRSEPGRKSVVIKSPTGAAIICTADHEWLTPKGWREAIDIYSSGFRMYNILHAKNMRDLWDKAGQSKLGKDLREMSYRKLYLPLRAEQGFQGEGMYELWAQDICQKPMAESRNACQKNAWDYRTCQENKKDERAACRVGFLQREKGWSQVREVLSERRFEQESNSIPLSVGMGNGTWGNTSW
jgi:hypothetical protein